jgi:flagellar biosynthetic protein FlhB
MSEQADKDSKTEAPSEKKIADSVEKGETAVSKEVPILFSLGATLFVFAYFGPSGSATASAQLAAILDHAHEIRLTSVHELRQLLRHVGEIIALFSMPFAIAFLLAGVTGALVQNPPSVVWKRVAPDFSRVSPMKGWSRIYSVKGFVEFLKSVAKIVVTGLVVYISSHSFVPNMINGLYMDERAFLGEVHATTLTIIATITATMLVIATLDYAWSKSQWLRDLRMTKQEVKDELKQSMGDPILKARQRSVAIGRARNRMIQAVPEATVIIANPTHYAVALRYVFKQDAAPVVIARGRDHVALRIRHAGETHKVPVIENVPLAQALYRSTKLDQVIPEEFFAPVAQIISIINRRSRPVSPAQ